MVDGSIFPTGSTAGLSSPHLEIRETSVTEFRVAGRDLFQAHSEEVTAAGLDIGTLDLDWPIFERLEDAGLLLSLGLWYGNRLIGYTISVLTPDLLHAGKTHGQVQAVYLQPKHRNTTVAKLVLDATELVAESRGASAFFWLAPRGGPLERLLERRDGTKPVCTQFVRMF